MSWRLFWLGLVLLFALYILIQLSGPTRPPIAAGIDLSQALSDESGAFAPVIPGRKFEFPADHGAHPDFKTEWWYFTGHLISVDGRKFGYQLTLFRSGINPPSDPVSKGSEWNAASIMMGHLALSDPHTGTFRDFERFSRCALGLAGYLPNAEKIWLEDWEIRREVGGWSLQASQEGNSFSLFLSDLKPPTLHGEGGYSRKGPEPKHASYYVSQTRLHTEGSLSLDGRQFQVSGTSWFDHEWSSEILAPGLVGWDWFSLQLSDQTELMYFRLRREDGSVEPVSSGALIQADGGKKDLVNSQVKVEVLDRHTAQSGRIYPSKWRIEVPNEGLTLTVTPTQLNQEMSTGVTYWEGAVSVTGRRGNEPVSGVGFVELTGY